MKSLYCLAPESRVNGANHLATCIGPGMRLQDGTLADLQTFRTATHEDAEGNRYVWVDARISDGKAQAIHMLKANPDLLQRPAFDTGSEIDMVAAKAELVALVLLDDEEAVAGDYMLVGIDRNVMPEGVTRIVEA